MSLVHHVPDHITIPTQHDAATDGGLFCSQAATKDVDGHSRPRTCRRDRKGALRFPTILWLSYEFSGTERQVGALRFPIILWLSYGISGTDRQVRAEAVAEERSRSTASRYPILLRLPYAVSGAGIG
eukprot:2097257-Rhodomonas_salina.2